MMMIIKVYVMLLPATRSEPIIMAGALMTPPIHTKARLAADCFSSGLTFVTALLSAMLSSLSPFSPVFVYPS